MSRPLAVKGGGACTKHVLNTRLSSALCAEEVLNARVGTMLAWAPGVRRQAGTTMGAAGSVTLSGPKAVRHDASACAGDGDPLVRTEERITSTAHASASDLYREHSTGLVRQLVRHTGCGEAARDLAQEAFLRFLRLPSWRVGLIDQPEAYLRQISTNLARDWGRSRARQRCSDTPQFAREGQIDQVAVLESRDTLRRLETAISTLRPKTRAIFLAHRLDGLSYSEIAELTGLSVKGVEKQMSKAIAKIDRLLDRP